MSSSTPKRSLQPRWVIGQTKPIQDIYDLKEVLGQKGANGLARRAIHKETGEVFAVKVVDKWPIKYEKVHPNKWLNALKREIELMKTMDHPNVIHFRDCFEDQHYVYMVMEICEGQELYNRIVDKGRWKDESDAADIFRMIMKGVKYLHDKKVAHCDLKPDNFLFKSQADKAQLKIIDFGMSKLIQERPDKYHNVAEGTTYYMAPEVLERKYFHACDIWSAGVVLYIMLIGMPPFNASSRIYKGAAQTRKIKQKIAKGFYDEVREGYGPWFPAERPISRDAMDLISKMLVTDPAIRLTAREVLEHPWISAKSYDPLAPIVLESLRMFQLQNRLKLIVLHLMLEILSYEELEMCQKTFQAIDTDGDGVLSFQELRHALTQSQWNSQTEVALTELSTIIQQSDVLEQNQGIEYNEMLLTLIHRKLQMSEERLWRAFCVIDSDANGAISTDELTCTVSKLQDQDGLSLILNETDLKEIVREVDQDNDGFVDYNEFLVNWSTDIFNETKVGIPITQDLDDDVIMSDRIAFSNSDGELKNNSDHSAGVKRGSTDLDLMSTSPASSSSSQLSLSSSSSPTSSSSSDPMVDDSHSSAIITQQRSTTDATAGASPHFSLAHCSTVQDDEDDEGQVDNNLRDESTFEDPMIYIQEANISAKNNGQSANGQSAQ